MAAASSTDRVWEVALKFMVPLSIGVGSWLVATAIAHESRLAVIEDSRFTPKDGIALERRIKDELPPQWLRDDMTEIKALLISLDKRIRELEKR